MKFIDNNIESVLKKSMLIWSRNWLRLPKMIYLNVDASGGGGNHFGHLQTRGVNNFQNFAAVLYGGTLFFFCSVWEAPMLILQVFRRFCDYYIQKPRIKSRPYQVEYI